MTKAESYSIAVAAGSVIARASFLNEMDRLSDEVGFTLLKGASQKVDQLIAIIIKQNGEASLNSIVKYILRIQTKQKHTYKTAEFPFGNGNSAVSYFLIC